MAFPPHSTPQSRNKKLSKPKLSREEKQHLLKNVKRELRQSTLFVERAPLTRLIREIVRSNTSEEFRMQRSALYYLQFVAQSWLVEVLGKANEAVNPKTYTLRPEQMRNAVDKLVAEHKEVTKKRTRKPTHPKRNPKDRIVEFFQARHGPTPGRYDTVEAPKEVPQFIREVIPNALNEVKRFEMDHLRQDTTWVEGRLMTQFPVTVGVKHTRKLEQLLVEDLENWRPRT